MIQAIELRELVIQPALKGIHLYSPEAEELLIATCAQESEDGYYLKQTVGGANAALGIFQMQPETHETIWNTTLIKNSGLGFLVLTSCSYTLRPKPEVMVYNLLYAAVMARIFWLHVDEPMPAVNDKDRRWYLYKKYWNTYAGKATQQEFEANYAKYVKGGR